MTSNQNDTVLDNNHDNNENDGNANLNDEHKGHLNTEIVDVSNETSEVNNQNSENIVAKSENEILETELQVGDSSLDMFDNDTQLISVIQVSQSSNSQESITISPSSKFVQINDEIVSTSDVDAEFEDALEEPINDLAIGNRVQEIEPVEVQAEELEDEEEDFEEFEVNEEEERYLDGDLFEDQEDEGGFVIIGDEEHLRTQGVVEEEHDVLEEVDYNMTLPPQHLYLDTEMRDIEGYSWWAEGELVDLTLVPISVMVVPGQTLPLRLHDYRINSSIIRNILDNNHNTFGAINLDSEHPYRERMFVDGSWSKRGVTLQIIEVSERTTQQIVMKCIGRQRFKVITTHMRSPYEVKAQVQIKEDHVPTPIHDPSGQLQNFVKFGPWPAWVYQSHDYTYIVQKIRAEICKFSPHVDLKVAPADPVMFSYWLISTMPFRNKDRCAMLREDSLVARLRTQLDLLKVIHENQYQFCCGNCKEVGNNTSITNCVQLFSMSADGPAASYVNPHGFLHETITVYSVQHAVSFGRPTAQDSWFPGYKWNYIHCQVCSQHLGWKFTADNRHPGTFYGLRRGTVQVVDTLQAPDQEVI